MNWYVKVLKNYAVFKGRARRKEYWMFVLFHFLFSVVAALLDNLLGTTVLEIGYGAIYIGYQLAILVPSLAVLVRRLHDSGKSGWYFFVSFIPIAGAIWILVLLLIEGNTGPNQYGPDPKTSGEVSGEESLDAHLSE